MATPLRAPVRAPVRGPVRAPVRAQVEETAERLAAVFDVLGEPGRVRILLELLAGDERSVGDLARAAGLSESATSHTLRLLRARGVVRARRAGRVVYSSLADDHVRTLLGVALEHLAHEGSGP